MSVPESIAWLESTVSHHTASAATIYAKAILDELERLSTQLDACARELDERERMRDREHGANVSLQATFDELEERSRLARDAWDRQSAELNARLNEKDERLALVEGTLKDVHYGLLHQPEFSREEIAKAIADVVTPYSKGERP